MNRVYLVAGVVIAVGAPGCAAVLGLDGGNSTDAGDGSADASAATATDAQSVNGEPQPGSDGGRAPITPADAGTDAAVVCAPGTANCNGNPSDGCEQNLNDPNHCGDCTTVCGPMTACMANTCCITDNGPCTVDSDCCSGSCKGPKCHK